MHRKQGVTPGKMTRVAFPTLFLRLINGLIVDCPGCHF